MKTDRLETLVQAIDQADWTIVHSTNGLATQEAWRQRGRLIQQIMDETHMTREEVLGMVGSPWKKMSKNGRRKGGKLIVDGDSKLAMIRFPSSGADPGFRIESIQFDRFEPVVDVKIPIVVGLSGTRRGVVVREAKADLHVTVEEIEGDAVGITYRIVASAKDVEDVES